MTNNTTNANEPDSETESALTDPSDEVTDSSDDVIEAGDIDLDADDAPDDVPGTGAVSGGFGFAGLALAVVSLTTNWTSEVVANHGYYRAEANAGSSGLSAQQQLDLAATGWHTQGWWALVFAAAAVVFGAVVLLWPGTGRSGDAPAWARAAATGAVIVGLVGVILAVLTVVGVFGGHLTAPTSAG